jgi:hypothetical protein
MYCAAKLRSLDISLSGAEYHFWNNMQGSELTYTGERTMAVSVSKLVRILGSLQFASLEEQKTQCRSMPRQD